jgi:hypothetical protein
MYYYELILLTYHLDSLSITSIQAKKPPYLIAPHRISSTVRAIHGYEEEVDIPQRRCPVHFVLVHLPTTDLMEIPLIRLVVHVEVFHGKASMGTPLRRRLVAAPGQLPHDAPVEHIRGDLIHVRVGRGSTCGQIAIVVCAKVA